MKKYIIILIVGLFYSCSVSDDPMPTLINTNVFGTYLEDGYSSGKLIINKKYIDYLGHWYTSEYNLTQDSIKFNFSNHQEGTISDSVTWWFNLKIYDDRLEGNHYRTVNWDSNKIFYPGIKTFRKL